MSVDHFATIWVGMMVIAIAANADERRHEKDSPALESRQEGIDQAQLADACALDRPSKEDKKKRKPKTAKWDGKNKCAMIDNTPKPGVGCTMGGSGKSNGWYFDPASKGCKDTHDLGSCSSEGPFESKAVCQEAVRNGECEPQK